MRRPSAMLLVCILTLPAACGGSDEFKARDGDGGPAGLGGEGGGAGSGAAGSGAAGGGNATSTGGSTNTGGMGGAGGVVGTGGSGGVFVGVEWAAVCAHSASVFCARLSECAPLLLDITYGDSATCGAEAAASCESGVGLPGVTATPEEYDACIDAFESQSCDDWFSGHAPDVCRSLTGSLPVGSGCTQGIQCSTGFCGGATINGCGECVNVASDGGSCSNITGPQCDTGFRCVSDLCEPDPAVGDVCSTNTDCGLQLNCVNGQCAALQDLDEPCDSTLRCDLFRRALVCSSETNLCVRMPIPGLGEPCDLFCEQGTQCNFLAMEPTCVAQRQLGETCDLTGAAPCASDLECVDGLCEEPAAIDCSMR